MMYVYPQTYNAGEEGMLLMQMEPINLAYLFFLQVLYATVPVGMM